jgi:hypothetical protein
VPLTKLIANLLSRHAEASLLFPLAFLKSLYILADRSEMRGFFASLRMTNSFTNDEQTVYEMTNGFD